MIGFILNLLQYAKPYRGRLILGILFGILAGLMEPLMVFIVALVYTVVFQDPSVLAEIQQRLPSFLKQYVAAGNFSVNQGEMNPRVAILLISMIPVVFLLRGVVSYLNVYLLQWAAIRTGQDLRIRLFENLINLSASFFNKARSAELMSRVLIDTDSLRHLISNSLATLIKDPVTIVVMFVGLLWQAPKLTLIAMLVLPVCIVPIAVYGRKGRKAAKRAMEISADMNNVMMESFTGHRIIKAYNLEEAAARDFARAARDYITHYMKLIRSLEIPGPMLEVAGSIGVAILLAYAVLMATPGERPNGREFLLLVIGIITMYRPMKNVVRLYASLEQARAASQRVFELLATKSNMPERENPTPLKAAGADINFEDVSFAYGEKRVLQNITLRVKSGQLIALVGASGSGKTTLTNLLLRFYDPSSGSIRIGGTDIREVSTRQLREQIAVVTQETILFNETIHNNIAAGRPNASDAEIVAAAKHAHAHEFIMEKDGQYTAVIGERGVELSGGQRQRLAIARAILKDAPILILDEATSALDTEAERIVQAALEELMVGRTTFCIAHRLSTIQKADLIVAMHEGRIAEMGTHEELLKRGGIYSNLHNLQFGQ